MSAKYITIITSCGNKENAIQLSQILITQKLAACVQRSVIESTYQWQDELCEDQEIQLQIKTRSELFDAVCQCIKQHHSYDTPEIIAIPILQGEERYLHWIDENTRSK